MFQKNLRGLGVDIGGTSIRAACVSKDGIESEIWRIETQRIPTLSDLVRFLTDCIGKVEKSGGVSAIGIGVPGPYNAHTGLLSKLPNIKGWEAYPLQSAIRDAFPSLAVSVINDADAAAYGEYFFGTVRGLPDFALLTLGTGLGSSFFIGGKHYIGPGGYSSELGHIPIAVTGPICGCGARGHVESFLSSRQTATWIQKKVQAGVRTLLTTNSYSRGEARFDLIIQCARNHDQLARKALNRYAYYLGRTLAVVANLFNMQITVLAGGIAPAWDMFRETSLREMRRSCFPDQGHMTVIQSTLGETAGILGAATHALAGFPLHHADFHSS